MILCTLMLMLSTHPGRAWLEIIVAANMIAIAASLAALAYAQEPERSTLNVPAGRDYWGLMPNCNTSIWVWANREENSEERRRTFEFQGINWIEYHSGQPVEILERIEVEEPTPIPGLFRHGPEGCVGVRLVNGEQEGWVEKTLVAPTAREVAVKAAARKAEQDRQARLKKAEQDRQASVARAEQEQQARLATMATLFSGAELLFIGADRKCSEQFVQASEMEGLEKRKRLAELISYSCGFATRPGVHISILQSANGYSLVRLEDGKEAGKTGWVPLKWMIQPGSR